MRWRRCAASACRPDMTETRPQDPRPLQGLRIGFAGLRLMGRPMALHLLEAGPTCACGTVRARRGRCSDLNAGLRHTRRPWRASTIVVLMVATPMPSIRCCSEIGPGIRVWMQGTLVVDMGTTSVMATRDLAGRPVTGRCGLRRCACVGR